MLNNPRVLHYDFAHKAIKHFVKHDPLKFFAVMASDDQREFIEHIWLSVCKHHSYEKNLTISPHEIKCVVTNINSYPLIIIEMPEVRGLTEAIFIGIVLTIDLNKEVIPENATYRYFTLELGEDIDDSERTVFCEWRDDKHINYGNGPNRNIYSFIEVIESMI